MIEDHEYTGILFKCCKTVQTITISAEEEIALESEGEITILRDCDTCKTQREFKVRRDGKRTSFTMILD